VGKSGKKTLWCN